MRNIIYSIGIFLLLTSCAKDKKIVLTKPVAEEAQNITESKGYKLMESKCFICHFPKPDPSKRSQMIAPPMLRVQEHYKPIYPKKEDFVKAVVAWVKNPTEEMIEMPGTVRKWGMMPKLGYDEIEVALIAEVLFELDFGSSPKMHEKNKKHGSKLELNHGEKWQMDPNTMKKVTAIIEELNSFTSDNASDYNVFGKKIFTNAKAVLLDKSITGEKLVQVQSFFHNIEGSMHQMMQVKTAEEGKELQAILKKKFDKFDKFFE